MRRMNGVALIVVFLLASASVQAQTDQQPSVPRLINITGVYRPASGQPSAPVETVTLAIYADEQGGAPLWQETQTVAIDDRGRYSLLLGATVGSGIPIEIFGSGDAHWLGTRFERPGEVEGPRVRLTSVPYALRAAEADTLGGRPASDYQLAATATGDADAKSATAATRSDVAGPTGTANFLPKYVDSVNFGDSALYEVGGQAGLGTTTPFDIFHVRYTNTGGNLTGFAVQNMGNTATSYSGMLFYDQNNQLGQFQGFNNSTHEYRINNIARVTPGGAFNGSINFMIGSTSRFFVGSNGNIGIGTASPTANLEVSNALFAGANPASITMATYSSAPGGSFITGRKARGTSAAPTAAQAGDILLSLSGRGYGATNFGLGGGATIGINATENYSDTNQGGRIQFLTAQNGTTTLIPRMAVNHDGNVGIGTLNPDAPLEVFRQGDAFVQTTAFNNNGGEPFAAFFAQGARGTPAAPTALQLGDLLGFFGMGGYGATSFGPPQAALAAAAAENWTDTARGSAIGLLVTPLGTSDAVLGLAILPNGNVGIGTPEDVNGFPTAADRVQVFGDIRVGTTGTNGCIKNFAGTGIVGTCSSDRRLKKDITPFGPTLDKLTSLQPVHYFWRAGEFPNRHFGNARNDGLIAQDVEQVMPELVAADGDGYKAVDYSKLPLLTIQAVKELKAENDTLKAQVAALTQQVEHDPLKQRVAELERVIAEMVARQK
jgi:endosialidase-like protein